MVDKAYLGEKLKRLRKAKKLSQRALAAKSGVAYATIQELEKAKGNPKLDTLDALSQCLDEPLVIIPGPKVIDAPAALPAQPQYDPTVYELARIIHYVKHTEPVIRLSALLMLTGLKEYSQKLRAIPGGAPFASAIEKFPRP